MSSSCISSSGSNSNNNRSQQQQEQRQQQAAAASKQHHHQHRRVALLPLPVPPSSTRQQHLVWFDIVMYSIVEFCFATVAYTCQVCYTTLDQNLYRILYATRFCLYYSFGSLPFWTAERCLQSSDSCRPAHLQADPCLVSHCLRQIPLGHRQRLPFNSLS